MSFLFKTAKRGSSKSLSNKNNNNNNNSNSNSSNGGRDSLGQSSSPQYQQQQQTSSLNNNISSVNENNGAIHAPTPADRYSRVLRTKEDLTPETATKVIQRYWLLCKNRKQLSKQFHQRKNIMAEVIKTEETYVNDLKTIVEVYHKPIQKKELITAKQLGTIFGHISMIYNLNQTFLNRLHDVQVSEQKRYEQQKSAIDKNLGIHDQPSLQFSHHNSVHVNNNNNHNNNNTNTLSTATPASVSPSNNNNNSNMLSTSLPPQSSTLSTSATLATTPPMMSHHASLMNMSSNNNNNHQQQQQLNHSLSSDSIDLHAPLHPNNNNNENSHNNNNHGSNNSTKDSSTGGSLTARSRMSNAAHLIKIEAIKTVEKVKKHDKSQKSDSSKPARKLSKRLSYGANKNQHSSSESNEEKAYQLLNAPNNHNNSSGGGGGNNNNNNNHSLALNLSHNSINTNINNYSNSVNNNNNSVTPRSQLIKNRFGTAFKETIPFMKLYTVYINNYAEILELLRELRKSNAQLDAYLKECKKKRSECRNMDIVSFLILPVQRIPRYQLLLRELLRNTPRSYADYQHLIDSYYTIVSVANHLNSMKKKKDGLAKTIDVQKRISNLVDDYQSLMERIHGSNNNNNSGGSGSDGSLTTDGAPSWQETLNRYKMYKNSLIQPNRHFVDEMKIELRRLHGSSMNQELVDTNNSSNGSSSTGEWRVYDAYLYTDMLMMILLDNGANGATILNHGSQTPVDDTDDPIIHHHVSGKNSSHHIKLADEDLKSEGLVYNLFLCFTIFESASNTTKSLQLRYMVGEHTYEIRFKNSEPFQKFCQLIQSQVNEERDKLKNTIFDRTLEDEDDSRDVDHAQRIAHNTMNELQSTIKKKQNATNLMIKGKNDFCMIRLRFDELKGEYDSLRRKLQEARNQSEESQINSQKDILIIEKKLSEVENVLNECMERMKLGLETLNGYCQTMKDLDQILLTCLRSDKIAFQSIFTTIDVMKDLNQSLVEHQMKVYQLKIQQRRQNKTNSKSEPVVGKGNDTTTAVTPSTNRGNEAVIATVASSSVPPLNPQIGSNSDGTTNGEVMNQIFLLQQEKKTLQDKIIDLEKQVHQRKVLFDNSCKERRKLKQELDELKHGGHIRSSQMIVEPPAPSFTEDQYNELLSQISLLNNTIDGLQTVNGGLLQQIEELKSTLALRESTDKLADQQQAQQSPDKMIEETQSGNHVNKQESESLVSAPQQQDEIVESLKQNNLELESQVDLLKSDVEKHKNQIKSMRKKLKRSNTFSSKTLDAKDDNLRVQLDMSRENIKLERRVSELEAIVDEQEDYKRKFVELQQMFLTEKLKFNEREQEYEQNMKDAEQRIQKLKSMGQRLDVDVLAPMESPSRQDVAQKILMFSRSESNLTQGNRRKTSSGQEISGTKAERVDKLERVLSQIATLAQESLKDAV